MSTFRQIEANKRNAQLSTGPTTEEGKAASRVNASKHGLSGDGTAPTPEELEQLQEQLELWRPSFQRELQGNDPDRELLFREMVLNGMRMERAQRREMDLHEDVRQRAATSWDADRRLLAESIGANLGKVRSPGLSVAKLRTFLQGSEWLLAQWICLKEILERGDSLSDFHIALYFGLIGRPPALRRDEEVSDSAKVLAVVLERLKAFEGDALDPARRLDARDQANAERRGFTVAISKDERLNRRYEDLAHRRYHAARKELKASQTLPAQAQSSTTPPPAPRPQSKGIDEVRVSAKQHAEFDSMLDDVFASKPTVARNEPSGASGKMHPTLTPRHANQVRITPARA